MRLFEFAASHGQPVARHVIATVREMRAMVHAAGMVLLFAIHLCPEPAFAAEVINPPASTATRTVYHSYYRVTGLLNYTIVEPDNWQFRVDARYEYDAWGNRSATFISSPATGEAAIASRDSSVSYGGRGQFPSSGINVLGQSSSASFDPLFGGLASATDPNGVTSQWQYDSFGRKTLEIRPDGNRSKWEYQYCSGVNGGTANCPEFAKYLVQVTPLAANGITVNGPWRKAYFDELDRGVSSETVGFDGASVIVVSTEYDARGRVVRKSQPYYKGANAQWSVASYDELDRISTLTNPDNTHSDYGYNGLSASVVNALGQATTRLMDSQGQLVRSTDNAGSMMTYQYDAFGNLWKTTDAKGNIILNGYDAVGHRTQMIDPDLGGWSYVRNALGQLVRQTDAKGQQVTLAYDRLGRMTGKTEPDLISAWTYDSCAHGVGSLCRVSADNGYSAVSSYDSFGRGNGSSTAIDTTYKAAVTFDSNGRVDTQTYPAGLVLKYVYSNLGYLKEVRDNNSNALYWSVQEMDAAGNFLLQKYGNNIATQMEFDPKTGLIKHAYAGAGNGVQNLTYEFDAIGNLQSRSDANQNLSESFLYDGLNRLTTSTVNSAGAGLATQSYAYDILGNFDTRSAVGKYIYDSARRSPHAVGTIELAAGGKRRYDYDANGNLIREEQRDAAGNIVPSKGRSASYTSFNMPLSINSASAAMRFVYDAEHQRIKEITPGLTTVFVHPDNAGSLSYEKDMRTDGSVEHRQFISIGGEVIAVVKQNGSGTAIRYFHRDHLGSATAISDESGTVIERMAYEPFGKRRFPAGNDDGANGIQGVNSDRGFTNHQHLDALGLIHMNGRVYDPVTGRFMTPDPGVPDPTNLQSFNRYSYTRNNPLSFVDPTGFEEDEKTGSSPADLRDQGEPPDRSSLPENPPQTVTVIGERPVNYTFTYWDRVIITNGILTPQMETRGTKGSANSGAAKSDFANFIGEIDFNGSARQFGLKLVGDFVKNNKGSFGGWGWLAEKAENYFDKPDESSANGVVASVGAAAVAMIMPGGARAKVAEEVAALSKAPLWTSTKAKSAVENAFGHWQKHAAEFPEFQNAKQYAEGARNFLTNPPAGALTKVRPNGDTLIYDAATNTFGSRAANGATRTIFRPQDGIEYWKRQ